MRPGPDGATVEDLGSKNGLLVNGVRIDRARELRPRDVLRIGETLVAFEDPGDAAAPALPPPLRPPRPWRPGRLTARRAAAALLALSAAALAVAGS